MGKFDKSSEPVYKIGDVLGNLSDGKKGKWNTMVLKMSWFDKPETLNIRDMNLDSDIVGKGVCLSDEEADKLVDLLIENDFGSIEVLEKHLERRKNIFTVNKNNIENAFDNPEESSGKIVIDIKGCD